MLVKPQRIVESLDRTVEEAAAVVHTAHHEVAAPVLGELVMQRDVELGELHVEEIVLSGQRLDGRDFVRSEAAPAARKPIQILARAAAQGPGVLVRELRLDGPRAGCRVDRVRRPHVEAQETEGREVARAQEAEVVALGSGKRRPEGRRRYQAACKDTPTHPHRISFCRRRPRRTTARKSGNSGSQNTRVTRTPYSLASLDRITRT